ncbi:class II glutamine amidotransferase [Myxococcaceae bacterium JPH2]|nr:class II glutamine amidotransferase [Myxococcaceae bacterium JPH2]
MCRLILASGRFQARDILEGAVAMAVGQTARHDSPLLYHPDGWGAVWRDSTSPSGISMVRDPRPAEVTALGSDLARVQTDFLAVHVRRASLSTTRGSAYTHPLQRQSDGWHFMHNGSQPTVYQLLGRERSHFDSAEYFDYIIPPGSEALDEEETLARLRAIPTPGANSGNAIAVSPDRAYLIHWRADVRMWPRYFTMQEYTEPGLRVVASEIIPTIAPVNRWKAVPIDRVIEFRFDTARRLAS